MVPLIVSKTIKPNDLHEEIKAKFKLPTFHIVDVDSNKERTKMIDQLTVFLDQFFRAVSRDPHGDKYRAQLTTGSVDYWYGPDMYREFIYRVYNPPSYVGKDGSFVIDGTLYTSFLLKQTLDFCSSTRRIYTEDKLKELVDKYHDKRIIIYTDDGCLALWQFLKCKGHFSKCHATNCDSFINKYIDKLILPIHYNAGFNLGKIDVIIILSTGLLYNDFHQMIGRVNRLDQHNDTEVYILTHDKWHLLNAESMVARYKDEFVTK